MSNTKHTPTPWHMSVEEKSRRDDVYIVGNPTGALGGARQLAYMVDTWTGASTEANAAFIVRAVNSHDQLVDVVKEMMALGERLVDDVYGYEFVRKAKAALTAAEAA